MADCSEITDDCLRQIEPTLLRFATRAVRERTLAEDLVQETFIAALESHGRFEGRSTLSTWMVSILARKVADHYRRRRREVLTGSPPAPEVPSHLHPPPGRPPEERLDETAALRIVERSLDQLGHAERMAITLCDIQQLPRERACELLGVKRIHLRVLLHRGRRKLRRILQDAEHGPEPT